MVQVDVFTDRALTGNSLAVFLDGRGLSTEQMQALAREMNLSETTFILPGDAAAEKTRGVRVRIFTVQEELPFAGHPTLGTAFVLRGQTAASADPDEVRLDLNVGTVPVRFTAEACAARLRRNDAEESRIRRHPRRGRRRTSHRSDSR